MRVLSGLPGQAHARVIMTTTNRGNPTGALRAAVNRVRAVLPVAPAPAYAQPEEDSRAGWLRQLDRVRAALEQARDDLVDHGWTGGGWFTVPTADGGGRLASQAEAFGLVRPSGGVLSACLVGTLLQRCDDADRATSVRDVWGCVDELVEALHEQAGHASFPPGRCYPHEERRARLRVLTDWNDAPGRTLEEVLGLVDRAVGRTIVGACRFS